MVGTTEQSKSVNYCLFGLNSTWMKFNGLVHFSYFDFIMGWNYFRNKQRLQFEGPHLPLMIGVWIITTVYHTCHVSIAGRSSDIWFIVEVWAFNTKS
jgi:hypothetical protein